MLYACWSVKGGSGTTVFAVGLALTLAGKADKVTIVDLGGDVPAVLGLPEPTCPGVRDWLADPHRVHQELAHLGVQATPQLRVIHAGSAYGFEADALDELIQGLEGHVVLDLGTLQPHESLHNALHANWLIIRPCYLALRRAARLATRPNGVIVMREVGRALTSRDICTVTGSPVIGEISVCDRVARSVDAGLLATRLPKQFASEIEGIL